MLIFYTIMFLIGGACLIKIFHFATRRGQIFGAYQNVLDNLYEHRNELYSNLGKALGNCEMCMSFWFSFIWTITYLIICIQEHLLFAHIFSCIIWFLSFHCLSTILCVYSITRLFNNKK